MFDVVFEGVFEVVSAAIEESIDLKGADGVELHLVIPLPNGLHAEKTGTFDSEEEEEEEEEDDEEDLEEEEEEAG